jgi:hypothetical protein
MDKFIGTALAMAAAVAVSGVGLQITQIEFVLTVEQGTSYQLTFAVRNDSEAPQVVSLYLGDWDRDINGVNRFYPVGTIPRSLSPWLSLSHTQLPLAPGEAREVTVTLTIPSPDQQTLAGTYWGIIFVQGEPRPVRREGATVMAIERFGVKVYATIAGTEQPSGEVKGLEFIPQEDGLKVEVLYQNTGNVHSWVEGVVEVVDRTGTVVESVPLERFPVLPGAQRLISASLPPLPAGIYQVRAVLDYQGEVLVAGVRVLRVS